MNNSDQSNTGDGNQGPPRDLMGSIPRKKIPRKNLSSSSGGASESISSSSVMNDIPIPRKYNNNSSSSSAVYNEMDSMPIPRRSISQSNSNRPPPSASSTNNFSRRHYQHDGAASTVPQRQRSNSPLSGVSSGGSGRNLNSGANPAAHRPRKNVRIVSEFPLVLRIRTKGVPVDKGGIPPSPALPLAPRRHGSDSGGVSLRRTPKRKRISKSYQELADTDSDDFLTDEEEEQQTGRLKKKGRASNTVSRNTAIAIDGSGALKTSLEATMSAEAEANIAAGVGAGEAIPPFATDPPPPGALSTLWYSRELFCHVFVMEKACGWKTRPKIELVEVTTTSSGTIDKINPTNNAPESGKQPESEMAMSVASSTSVSMDTSLGETPSNTNAIPTTSTPGSISLAEAISFQQKALQNQDFWTDTHKRMNVSRINLQQCPVVLAMKVAKEEASAKVNKQTNQDMAPLKKYQLKVVGREEVLLVKWRGRSHMHCSWERASDIQRLDPSNNTARAKIKRFYQQQELILGINWKRVLEEERATVAGIHTHGKTIITTKDAAAAVDEDAATAHEEFFPPQNLELDRILACDESELNMQVLANQRALNLQTEKKVERDREEAELHQDEPDSTEHEGASNDDKATKAIWNLISVLTGPSTSTKILDPEPEWDPEDNVRYVVKWKNLPYAEMTWEYWRDIKHDAVELAEDFWHRQKPPELTAEQLTSRGKSVADKVPNIRDFCKFKSSPVYGISKRSRPIGSLKGTAQIAAAPADDEERSPGFRLRSYQLEGLNWLLFNWWNRRSCILADEMGLGKTIQSAAFLQELQNLPKADLAVRGPFLIVAPLSLVGQWKSELASWAPDMNVLVYHGSADARDFLVQQEFYYTDQFVPKPLTIKLKRAHVTKFHVLITTYELALKDSAVLSKIHWKTLIVDEAHRLKNRKARLFIELANVPRDYCVLLTGTPIANATEELWALLHFANPKIFHDKDSFLEKFGQVTDAEQVKELHNLLKPYLLRRVKEDVEKSLPPKEETILEVSLTPIQKKFYKAIYERNTAFLFKGSKPSNAPSLMNVMMELRKCCNHPFLVKGAEDRILIDAAAKLEQQGAADTTKIAGDDKLDSDKKNEIEVKVNATNKKTEQDTTDNTEQQKPPAAIDYVKIFGEQLVKSSGKMVLMQKLLQKLFVGGHKVLIFSQMVRVLDLLEELLKIEKYRYERLDGSTSSSSRLAAVDRFTRKSCRRFVMLLSTRAGGLGLNLTAADNVIIFDSDWNPQNDLQAMARAHRIGQTRAVRVYRLLTAKTYEMHMFHSASLKLGLERAVLSQNREQQDNGDTDSASKSNKKSEKEAQAKEIDELLKKGAYDVFRDEDDIEAEKFMETDIDQLLENSSKKVTYGASSTQSLGSGLGSFSKASFVADTAEGEKDVDLDDPDFWAKAVGLEAVEETPEELAAMIDDGVKRSRKQVQVYDPYAEEAEAEQRRQDKLEMEKQLEKEEKERARLEKKQKKEAAKEKKKREREESKLKQQEAAEKKATLKFSDKFINGDRSKQGLQLVKEARPKKSKKSDRQRALKRTENEDPVLERLKQAWEAPQRNRASAAMLRFGFGRFCKIRHESNLTSLALQDLECFVRCYVYQQSLQVAVMLLDRLRDKQQESNQQVNMDDFRSLFQEWLGIKCARELNWICDSVCTVMKLHWQVEERRLFLRMPVILAEPVFVADFRRGGALRALRRTGILERLNRLVEDCLDTILSDLGQEELDKRGLLLGVTYHNDLTTLDADLKVRFVTAEEFSLQVAKVYTKLAGPAPAVWWDRQCDVALIVGSFVHGLGNYIAMRNDVDLPFSENIRRAAVQDPGNVHATTVFRTACEGARRVFDDALENAKIKAELEVQAAVAAARKAAAKREEEAALLRKGGAEAEVVMSNMPDTQVENAFAYDGSDSHFVTLTRMQKHIHAAVRKEANAVNALGATFSGDNSSPEMQLDVAKNSHEAKGAVESQDKITSGPLSGRAVRDHHLLPMPDARVLDHRLLRVLKEMEKVVHADEDIESNDEEDMLTSLDLWEKSDDVFTNIEARSQALSAYWDQSELSHVLSEYSGIGLGASQCGTSHRSLNDGSDYSFGSASSQMAQVAYGTDAPRFLRALGVPMNMTRFAVTSLVHADQATVEHLLATERIRYYGMENKDASTSKDSFTNALHDENNRPASNDDNTVKMEFDNELSSIKEDAKEDVQSNISEHPKPTSNSNSSAEQTSSAQSPPVAGPTDLIPEAFRENAKLRANICLAVILYGFPSRAYKSNSSSVRPDLLSELVQHSNGFNEMSDASPDLHLFSLEKFRDAVISLGPDVDVLPSDALANYVESILLPHCLRLCVNGNGLTSRNARGSEGKYETALGVSLHPEPSQPHPSPLPDPCIKPQEHSLEAIGQANALLRRVRLLRTCQFLCCNHADNLVSAESIRTLVRSKLVSASLQGMPVWWCPWIHDVALLVQAARGGLFSVLSKREEDSIFSSTALQKFLYSSFVTDERVLPHAKHTSPDQVTLWIERQASRFPTLNQLERRIAFLCSQATVDVDEAEGVVRYDHVPMFDHGGWPRN